MIQTTNKHLPLQAREFLINAKNLQLRRACANILLINLKSTKDSFVVNELRHEIIGVLRKTLSLHPADTNALRALVLDDLGMRQNEIKSFVKAYMTSVDKAKLPTKGIELCIIASCIQIVMRHAIKVFQRKVLLNDLNICMIHMSR